MHTSFLQPGFHAFYVLAGSAGCQVLPFCGMAFFAFLALFPQHREVLGSQASVASARAAT